MISFIPCAEISLYRYKVGPVVRSLRKRMSSLHSTIAHGLMCTAPCSSLFLNHTLLFTEEHAFEYRDILEAEVPARKNQHSARDFWVSPKKLSAIVMTEYTTILKQVVKVH